MEAKLNRFYLTFILLFAFLLNSCKTKPPYLKMEDEYGQKYYKSRLHFLSEYGLCSCLSQIDSSKVDASLKVYYNISDDELLIDNKGNRIDSFMQENIKLLKQKEGSKYANGPTNIFDCISLFKSKRFKKFVKIIMK
ncbi:MAG TPA: hypothetical protein PKC62_05695 [Ferruginibacter sp.]|jgi:hypothetical protein|nr:hypothetical protein [Bacteroidota bacterium]MBS1925684.1 hypothetical protein [Bacteroidota bacterium]MCC6692277.1 hypothetical protein [Chitinophagaceae bacterium]HMT96162.1 hypothetical protein [Ferruginibacter sp.]HMU25662.1 hypothetical protein [Ferruginibacter sp.]